MLASVDAHDPAAWRARDMRQRPDWQLTLTAGHRAEIVSAVARSVRERRPIEALGDEPLALSTLGPILAGLRREVVEGRGVALIRGMPLEDLDREGIVRAWLGVGSWFGVPRPQNRAGHLMGHVFDLGEDRHDPATRLYRTSARQRFHVDSCDLVGLLCLRPAKQGGASAICSSVAVVDEIARTRPDLARVLEAPFVYDRKDEVPAGKGPWYEIPIVHRFAGRTSVFFARDFIESAQRRFPGVPRLTAAQVEALDLVEALAESDEFRLDMAFEPGDMQLLHNHVVLHARTAYEDWTDPARKRHLLRLWLSAHDARPLPPVFEERYGPLEAGRARGGISVPGARAHVPFEPA
jgi:hypothetical protein